MKRLSKIHTTLVLTITIGAVSSSVLLLYDFANRNTLDITSIEGWISTAIWIAWVSLPYLIFTNIGLMMIRAGRISPSGIMTLSIFQVLVGAVVYGYWVFVQHGMMSGLVFILFPVVLLAIFLGVLGVVLLMKRLLKQ